MSPCVSPPHDPDKHLARITRSAVETYGQTGDAEALAKRLCAAVNECGKGQASVPAPGVYRKGQGSI